MTDSSSFANTLSEPLRQPFWWAALASISLHGTLGASAPTISNLIYGGNSSKNGPGSVGLIELTPAEMSRLPQTIPPRSANSRFAIAPVPLPSNTKLAPPLPPEPSVINLPAMPPGMPPPGFFSPLPLPSPSFTAPPPPTPSPTLKTPPQKQQIVIPQQPNSGLIFPPLPGNFDPIIPPPPLPPSLTESPQFPGGDTEDEAEKLKKIIASRGGLPLFPDGAPVFTPEFPIGNNNSGVEQLSNLPGKYPHKNNQTTATPGGIRDSQPSGNPENPEPEQPGSNLSGDRQAMLDSGNKYIALFNEFKRAYPDLVTTGPTPVNVAYPTAACSQQLQGVAVFGAVVSPQGLIRAEPKTIVATGYGILDDAAKTAIINPSLIFPAASTHKLYQLAVAFTYDPKICGGVPLAPRSVPTEPKPAGQQVAPATPTEVKPPSETSPAAPNKPKPAATQAPSPQPQPATPQSPSPQPQPAATQSPSPQPQPAVEPSPSPEVAPSPVVEPSPSPEVAPSPVVEPSPSPEVTPAPAEPSPSPEVTPAPTTEPSPSTAPSPAPTQN
ncbi:MAG: hypothetical protein HC789_22200 [Microcoleus sp. CSU_2_2]|nr:hypothetical protein [Microcoleus sp. CSU_2_2]